MLFLVAALGVSRPGGSQVTGPELEFLGLQAGERLSEIDAVIHKTGGGGLSCDRSRLDPAVAECRAPFSDQAGRPVALWLSSMDSVTGILTVSGPVTSEQLTQWKTTLERSFGQVDAKVQGPQWMMQWVRRGRMLRLTWRVDQHEKFASVSLVDGHVLDDWGRRIRPRIRVRTAPPPHSPADSSAAH
jgi:hypothetical protein